MIRRLLLFALFLLLVTSVQALNITENLTFEATNDQNQAYRCFLPPTVLSAMAGSKVYIEGGGLVGSGIGKGESIEIGGIINQEANSGAIGEGNYATSNNGTGEELQRITPNVQEETFIHGQLLDEEGRPLGGQRIEVSWTNNQGKKRTILVTTLTREEALRLGDPNLEGYYFINKERLGVEEEELTISVITVNESVETTVQQPKPEAPQVRDQPVPYEAESNYEQFSERLRNWRSTLTSFLKHLWPFFLIIPLVLLLFGGQKAIVKTIQRVSERQENPSKVAKELREKPMKELLQKNPLIIAPQLKARQLLTLFLQTEHQFAIVVEKEELVGIVTAGDVLRKIVHEKQGLDQRKVGDIMTENVEVLLETTTLHQAISFMLKKRVRILPVVKKGKVIGTVTCKQLLKQLDRFFSLHISDARGMAAVREILEDGLLTEHDAPLSSVLHSLRGSSDDIVLVVKTRQAQGRRIRDLQGLVTERQILEELFNYSAGVEQTPTEAIMQKNPRSVNEGLSAFEANKILLELKTRSIPVVYGSEVRGVVKEKKLLRLLSEALSKIVPSGNL